MATYILRQETFAPVPQSPNCQRSGTVNSRHQSRPLDHFATAPLSPSHDGQSREEVSPSKSKAHRLQIPQEDLPEIGENESSDNQRHLPQAVTPIIARESADPVQLPPWQSRGVSQRTRNQASGCAFSTLSHAYQSAFCLRLYFIAEKMAAYELIRHRVLSGFP